MGRPEALQLQHQAQVQAQVRGIHHAHEQVRRRLGRMAAEDDVARDGLIERGGLEAVGARQIDEAVDAPGTRPDEPAFLALDRDARVVGDLLAAAGETVEECGLAAVGHADERQTRAAARPVPRPRRRSWHGGRCGRELDPDALGLATSQSEHGVTDAHDEGVAARAGLGENLDSLAR